MIITNKFNLPQTIVDAVTFEESTHKDTDYHVSGLQKGVKQLLLSQRHDKEIKVDASERLWALFGTAIHYVLDKGKDKNVFKEESLEAVILKRKVKGRADHFDGKKLSDWKFTSVWSTVYKSSYPDYEKQLNCYAFMYGLVGFVVEEIQTILLLKDWSKNKAREGGNYPPCQIKVVPLKLWPATAQRKYIEERITEFEKHKDMADDDIPECSSEERWKKDDKWAVMKEGNKRAVRVLDSEKEAEVMAETNPKYYVQHRPGLDNKCIDYCDCNTFCSYWKEKYGNKQS